MAGRVICVGHAALDYTFYVDAWPPPGTSAKIPARGFRVSGGGMAANAAVAVARLGGAAAFWGPVGSDREGALIADELVRYGVEVTGLAALPGKRSSVSAVIVDAAGERLIVGFRSDALAAEPDWLPLDAVGAAGAVLADVRWPNGAGAALARARDCGVPAILDADAAPREALVALCRRAGHAIFSRAGLEVLAPGQPTAAALSAALDLGVAVAGVTLGAAGFEFAEAREPHRYRHVAAPEVAVVDTTGAGDAFHGAYALAIAEGADVRSAAEFACAAAALKCTRRGTREAMPTRAEVEALRARA